VGKCVFAVTMNRQLILSIALVTNVAVMPTVSASPNFKNVKNVKAFVDSSSWELVVSGSSKREIQFDSNQTLPEGKAVILGNKEYRFWSVQAHPTLKGKFVLRIHSEKSAGWYSFSWNTSKKAWVSSNWPKHQIKQN